MTVLPWLQERLEAYCQVHGDNINDVYNKDAGAGWGPGNKVQLVRVIETDAKGYTWIEVTDGKMAVHARASAVDVESIETVTDARIEDLVSHVFHLELFKWARFTPTFTVPFTTEDDPNLPRRPRVCIDLVTVSYVGEGRMLGRRGKWAWETLDCARGLTDKAYEEILVDFRATYPVDGDDGLQGGVRDSVGVGRREDRAVAPKLIEARRRTVPTIADMEARLVSGASTKVTTSTVRPSPTPAPAVKPETKRKVLTIADVEARVASGVSSKALASLKGKGSTSMPPVDRGVKRKVPTIEMMEEPSRKLPTIPLSPPPPARLPSPIVSCQPVASTSRLPPPLPSPERAPRPPLPQTVARVRRPVPQIPPSPSPPPQTRPTRQLQPPARSSGRVATSPPSFAVPPPRQERPILVAAIDEGDSSEGEDMFRDVSEVEESYAVPYTDASESEDEDESEDPGRGYNRERSRDEEDDISVVQETSEEEDQEMDDVPMAFTQISPPFQSTLPPPTSTTSRPAPQPSPRPSPTVSSPAVPKAKKQVRVVSPHAPSSSSQVMPATLPLSPTSLARPTQRPTQVSTLSSSSPIKSGLSSLESLVPDDPASSQPLVESVPTTREVTQVGSFEEWSKAQGIKLPASQSWERVPLDMSTCPW